MNRRQLVESKGATCDNWNWCWSFINKAEHTIIFGAWDTNTEGAWAKILSHDWQNNERGRRNPGYDKSVEHVRMIQEEGYRLMTFPMIQKRLPNGKVKIKEVIPVLSLKKLVKKSDGWWATDPDEGVLEPLAEELIEPGNF